MFVRRWIKRIALLALIIAVVPALSNYESEIGVCASAETKIDLSSSRVHKGSLESRVAKLSFFGEELHVTHSLRWLETGTPWRLYVLGTFSYSFLGSDGKRLLTQEETLIIDEQFLNGKQAEWNNVARLRPPSDARYIVIEYQGTGLVTNPVLIRH